MNRMTSLALASLVLVSALLGTGCAFGGGAFSGGLELKKVVIYRNGVGYFERMGSVRSDTVRFKVRAGSVGDFLATLAVMERGGSTVKSASFATSTKRVPDPSGRGELVAVELELAGDDHELRVGYVSETPVWKPSYRLVRAGEGQVDLQAWGIVHNRSGEDWRGVTLSLVAGAPIAYEATLGTPVTPRRPTLTDHGEVIAAVPRGQVTAATLAPAPPADKPMRPMARKKGSGTEKKAEEAYGGASPEPEEAADGDFELTGVPAPLQRLAAITVSSGQTRYDLPSPVTVPNDSATMVMLVSQRVPGRLMFLYGPDGGVPESYRHPFQVARFTNATSGLLERGPIAIFDRGAFLGQGLVASVPTGGMATIPFALERGIAIERNARNDESGARVRRIEAGVLTIDRDVVVRTEYKVKNGMDASVDVFVRHARQHGSTLVDPPKGTEEDLPSGQALVPVTVAAKSDGVAAVAERRSFAMTADWYSTLADEAVRAYLSSKNADATASRLLKEAWELRKDLVGGSDRSRKLKDEQREIERATNETRQNLKAIEKSPSAADLRARLTRRLDDLAGRLDGITRTLVEADLKSNELRVRFNELVRQVRIAPITN